MQSISLFCRFRMLDYLDGDMSFEIPGNTKNSQPNDGEEQPKCDTKNQTVALPGIGPFPVVVIVIHSLLRHHIAVVLVPPPPVAGNAAGGGGGG